MVTRVKIGKKIFYGLFDRMGAFNVWSSKDWNAKKKFATWYFQNVDGLPENEKSAIILLESTGAIG